MVTGLPYAHLRLMVLMIKGIENIETKLKVYPLAEKNNPKPVQLHNLSNKYINTLHSQDITIFEEINEVVQEENT